MVMGTSKEVRPGNDLQPTVILLSSHSDSQDCRQRLLVRQEHPTIDNPTLAVQLLDKFSSLWQEPTLNEVNQRVRASTLPSG